MAAVVREALWQIRQIAHEALHRWPQLSPAVTDVGPSAARDWVAAVL
jgi:hypothetical protein